MTRPEISIVASHPEIVLPAMMTEVGNAEGEFDLGGLTRGFVNQAVEKVEKKVESLKEEIKEEGVFRELWSGLVEDVMGAKGQKPAA